MWTLRKKLPIKKDSSWLTGLNFKKKTKQLSSLFFTWSSHANCTAGRSLLRTAYLHCISVIWSNPYKLVPGILCQPIGLRPSPLELHSYTHQLFHWPIRAAPFGPIRDHGLVLLSICQFPSGFGSTLSLSTENQIFSGGAEPPKTSLVIRAVPVQSRLAQNGPEQRLAVIDYRLASLLGWVFVQWWYPNATNFISSLFGIF